MTWFKREAHEIVNDEEKTVVTEGLWVRCDACHKIIWKADLEANLDVCPHCDHHFRMAARTRIGLLLEPGYYLVDGDLRSTDPLDFTDLKPYKRRLAEAQRKTGLNDAILNAVGDLGPPPSPTSSSSETLTPDPESKPREAGAPGSAVSSPNLGSSGEPTGPPREAGAPSMTQSWVGSSGEPTGEPHKTGAPREAGAPGSAVSSPNLGSSGEPTSPPREAGAPSMTQSWVGSSGAPTSQPPTSITTPVILSVMEYAFIGGSMGAVVGETIARAADRALATRTPLVIVSASGGARMMEGIASLMQLAKVSAVLARLADARVPFLSLMTDPTTGGVTASFAMLGDLNLAEPGALIGFAGPRVIEQTIRQKLPPGFQRSEFLLEHGFLDAIVPRKNLKSYLAQTLHWMQAKT